MIKDGCLHLSFLHFLIHPLPDKDVKCLLDNTCIIGGKTKKWKSIRKRKSNKRR